MIISNTFHEKASSLGLDLLFSTTFCVPHVSLRLNIFRKRHACSRLHTFTKIDRVNNQTGVLFRDFYFLKFTSWVTRAFHSPENQKISSHFASHFFSASQCSNLFHFKNLSSAFDDIIHTFRHGVTKSNCHWNSGGLTSE